MPVFIDPGLQVERSSYHSLKLLIVWKPSIVNCDPSAVIECRCWSLLQQHLCPEGANSPASLKWWLPMQVLPLWGREDFLYLLLTTLYPSGAILKNYHALTFSCSHTLTFSQSHALTISCSHALMLSRSHALTFSRSHALTFSRSHVLLNSPHSK